MKMNCQEENYKKYKVKKNWSSLGEKTSVFFSLNLKPVPFLQTVIVNEIPHRIATMLLHNYKLAKLPSWDLHLQVAKSGPTWARKLGGRCSPYDKLYSKFSARGYWVSIIQQRMYRTMSSVCSLALLGGCWHKISLPLLTSKSIISIQRQTLARENITPVFIGLCCGNIKYY